MYCRRWSIIGNFTSWQRFTLVRYNVAMLWLFHTIKETFFRWAPVAVLMSIIFWWSAQSDLPGSGLYITWWDFLIKKTAHLIEYACLFFVWQRALNWQKPKEDYSYLLSFAFVCLYAISDEIHQSFTPGRHPQLRDVGFDMLGGLLIYLRLASFV